MRPADVFVEVLATLGKRTARYYLQMHAFNRFSLTRRKSSERRMYANSKLFLVFDLTVSPRRFGNNFVWRRHFVIATSPIGANPIKCQFLVAWCKQKTGSSFSHYVLPMSWRRTFCTTSSGSCDVVGNTATDNQKRLANRSPFPCFSIAIRQIGHSDRSFLALWPAFPALANPSAMTTSFSCKPL